MRAASHSSSSGRHAKPRPLNTSCSAFRTSSSSTTSNTSTPPTTSPSSTPAATAAADPLVGLQRCDDRQIQPPANPPTPAELEHVEELRHVAARVASRIVGLVADGSAFVKRAPAHSREHTVRDLLFPRQAATNSTSSAVDPAASSISSLATVSIPTQAVPPTSTTPTTLISTALPPTPTTSVVVPSSSAPPPTPTTSSALISTSTAPSAQPSTILTTSILVTQSTLAGPSSSEVVVVTITSSQSVTAPTAQSSNSSPSSSSSSNASLPTNANQNKGTSGGLSTGATTAIAVVIPVVVVTALVILGLWFWRRRKQRKSAEDERRKEMEDYGYNPNNDPTLPVTGAAVGGSEMTEDHSGYRGWGGTQATSTGRKASTTLSGGHAGGFSDTTSQPGGHHSPNSASVGDASSGDALVGGTAARRETLESGDGVGALGNAPAAGAGRGVQRGASNASSSYSAGGGSHTSAGGDAPIPVEYGYGDYDASNPYAQPGPYDSGHGGYGQPVVRDVSAKRSTRIESPTMRLQQGNSGIAQNF